VLTPSNEVYPWAETQGIFFIDTAQLTWFVVSHKAHMNVIHQWGIQKMLRNPVDLF
jgi:hypothetical protein